MDIQVLSPTKTVFKLMTDCYKTIIRVAFSLKVRVAHYEQVRIGMFAFIHSVIILFLKIFFSI